MEAKLLLPYFLIIVLAVAVGAVYLDKTEVEEIVLTDYATSKCYCI